MRRHIRLVQGKAQQFDKERAELEDKKERAVRGVERASLQLRALKVSMREWIVGFALSLSALQLLGACACCLGPRGVHGCFALALCASRGGADGRVSLAQGVEADTEEEVDFRLEAMKEDNKQMLHLLVGLGEEHTSLADSIHDALTAAGIAPPSRPASARSEVSSIQSDL